MKKNKSYEHKKTFIVVLAKDKYEFPLISSYSLSEISDFLGIGVETIKTAVCRNRVVCNLFRILRVDIQDNIYQEYGCANRDDYLEMLSSKYNVSFTTVKCLANSLGKEEDFSGLIKMLETISNI